MEIAELILKYIETLIYPCLIFFTMYLFRKQLSLLFGGKLTAKYKDIELSLERKSNELDSLKEANRFFAEKIEQNVDEIQVSLPENKKTMIFTLKELVQNIRAGLNYWESIVLNYLSGKSEPTIRGRIIDEATEDSDPWAKHKDERLAGMALTELAQKGLIEEIKKENQIYYTVHPVLKKME